MNVTELDRALRTLRLSGMADVLEARLRHAQAERLPPLDLLGMLGMLVNDELQRRQDRLLERRRAQARFRDPSRSLDSFDFSFNKKINRALLFELATGRFITQREDLLLIGPPGTGKSHLAQALGQAAIQQGHRVLYREAHLLLEEMTDATLDGTRKEIFTALSTVPLLIIDDLGMRKLPPTAAEDLLELIMRRYERASTILQPPGRRLGQAARRHSRRHRAPRPAPPPRARHYLRAAELAHEIATGDRLRDRLLPLTSLSPPEQWWPVLHCRSVAGFAMSTEGSPAVRAIHAARECGVGLRRLCRLLHRVFSSARRRLGCSAHLRGVRPELRAPEGDCARQRLTQRARASSGGRTGTRDDRFVENLGGSSGPYGLSNSYDASDRLEISRVPCAGVDELVYERGIPAPDFIKFDLESAEEFALHNGARVFTNRRPVVLLELHGQAAKNAAGDFFERYACEGVPVIDYRTRHYVCRSHADIDGRSRSAHDHLHADVKRERSAKARASVRHEMIVRREHFLRTHHRRAECTDLHAGGEGCLHRRRRAVSSSYRKQWQISR